MEDRDGIRRRRLVRFDAKGSENRDDIQTTTGRQARRKKPIHRPVRLSPVHWPSSLRNTVAAQQVSPRSLASTVKTNRTPSSKQVAGKRPAWQRAVVDWWGESRAIPGQELVTDLKRWPFALQALLSLAAASAFYPLAQGQASCGRTGNRTKKNKKKKKKKQKNRMPSLEHAISSMGLAPVWLCGPAVAGFLRPGLLATRRYFLLSSPIFPRPG